MPSANRAARIRAGFTLIELLVTLAIAVIVLSMAFPAMHRLISKTGVDVAQHKLLGALQYARGQAASRNRPVTLCKSADGQSCTTAGDWSQGWLVYLPDPSNTQIADSNRLRAEPALAGDLHITGNGHVADAITFGPAGFAYGGNGTLTIAVPDNNHPVAIIISNAGRVRVERQ